MSVIVSTWVPAMPQAAQTGSVPTWAKSRVFSTKLHRWTSSAKSEAVTSFPNPSSRVPMSASSFR